MSDVDSCVSLEIGYFNIFCNSTVHRSHVHQMYIALIILCMQTLSNGTKCLFLQIGLTDHTNSVHQPASRVEQCHICKSNGRTSIHVDLAKHIEMFHKTCRICPKILELNSFVRKMTERGIDNIQPYSCVECSKTFTWDDTSDWYTLRLEIANPARIPPLNPGTKIIKLLLLLLMVVLVTIEGC